MSVASMLPDDMVETGLPDHFKGEITKARLIPWTYPNGSLDHYILAAAIEITPDKEEDIDKFTEFYSAGQLSHFVPSQDGENPQGGSDKDYASLAEGETELEDGDSDDMAGWYALGVGGHEELNKGTKYAEMLRSLLKVGFDQSKITSDMRFLEGTYGQWDRIPQEERKSLQRGKKERPNLILVITELLEVKKAKGGKRKKAADGVSSSDREKLVELVLKGLKSEDGVLPKVKIPVLIMQSDFEGKKMVKLSDLAMSDSFLSSGPWDYDEDQEELSSE